MRLALRPEDSPRELIGDVVRRVDLPKENEFLSDISYCSKNNLLAAISVKGAPNIWDLKTQQALYKGPGYGTR